MKSKILIGLLLLLSLLVSGCLNGTPYSDNPCKDAAFIDYDMNNATCNYGGPHCACYLKICGELSCQKVEGSMIEFKLKDGWRET